VSNQGEQVAFGRNYSTDYFTDVLKNTSAAWLRSVLPGTAPVFAMVATPACHDPFDPAPQYAAEFVSSNAPRTPNWNTGMEGKHWLVSKRLPMEPAAIAFSDLIHRRRLATLRSVDDLVETLHDTVGSFAGRIESTWWIFTSDVRALLTSCGNPPPLHSVAHSIDKALALSEIALLCVYVDFYHVHRTASISGSLRSFPTSVCHMKTIFGFLLSFAGRRRRQTVSGLGQEAACRTQQC